MASRFWELIVAGCVVVAGGLVGFAPGQGVKDVGVVPTTVSRFVFSFEDKVPVEGIAVAAGAKYSEAVGYGWDIGGGVPSAVGEGAASAVGAEMPCFFSARVPEGNYRVTVTVGNPKADAVTTVKAELRRTMVDRVKTAAGEPSKQTFIVNVRRTEISPGVAVRLKPREMQKTYGGENWAWDDKLTLEFCGEHAAVSDVVIEKVDVPVVYLAGDSTVCDQPAEPFNSWGQMITAWLKPDIAVSNHAESGETAAAFYGERRMDKIMSTLKKGDYLLVQFGHNDMKTAASAGRYRELLTRFVKEARSKGATPVLLTPVSRESFGADGKITNSFVAKTGEDLPAIMKEVAAAEQVALIDLQAMSARLYETVGRGRSQVLFANAAEMTHHSDYGSYEIAQCVLQGLVEQKVPLAEHIVDRFKGFDPSKPDAIENLKLGMDPVPARVATPEGN